MRPLLQFVRLQPFDPSEPDGRVNERLRRVTLSALGAIGSRGLGFLGWIVIAPVALRHLGIERYGLWVTLTSLSAALGFADFGLNNSLLNALSEANGREDREAALRHLSAATALLAAIGFSLALMAVTSFWIVPWARVFNVSSARAVAEATPATAAFAICFLIELVLSPTNQVRAAYQESFIGSLFIALGNVLSIGSVIALVLADAHLAWIVLAMAGGPALALAFNALFLFRRHRPWLLPRRSHLSRDTSSRLLSRGGLFFLLQMAAALAFSFDNLIASRVLGPGSAAELSLVTRLFALAPAATTMVLTPLWPAYAEAAARGDVAFLRTTLWRSSALALLAVGLPSMLLASSGPRIFGLWLGSAAPHPGPSLLWACAVWSMLSIVGTSLSFFLNALDELRFQAFFGMLMALLAVLLKIVLAKVLGEPGIVWATVLAYSVISVLPMALYGPRLLRRAVAAARTGATAAIP